MKWSTNVESYFDLYFIEPKYKIYKDLGNIINIDSINFKIIEILNYDGIKIIIGPMGSGKSTLLLWLFLSHQKRTQLDQRISLKIYNFSDILNNSDIINELNTSCNPHEYIFIDSLYESSLEYDSNKIKSVLYLIRKLNNVVVACRSPFFYDNIVPQINDKISIIIELLPLYKDKQIKLISNYLKNICKDGDTYVR